ncbi:protein FAM91A1 isoform X2 [Centruroides vittatus]|uniref:protein FAM91A1 isoform X2 n=1 Tax=Centruroides vittatus TaxID=120091 RepID=UPI00350FB56C
MNTDIESYIRDNCTWELLPLTIKQLLGNSQKEYEKCVIHYSVKNQLKYRGNLVRHVKKEERSYYEELLRYSREHLMLYPYHLSDFIVTRMRLTPFQYYISIMQNLMEQEKSYDALPNFTAADCLRLLGIGRNQYIDLMNKCRSSKKIFGVRLKSVRELLPVKPIDVPIEPWWIARVGFVTEDDVKIISASEKQLIDKIIDEGPQTAGSLEAKCVKSLYIKGLIYMDVPIEDDDYIVVPPLEGFVMNRVLGDYFETLLYKLFVSLDEQTSVCELANVLQTDLQLVKNAISMYCRLGFAYKKRSDTDPNLYHPSWKGVLSSKQSKARPEDVETFMDALNCELEKEGIVVEFSNPINKQDSFEEQVPAVFGGSTHSKRIGFLFDSTLTAFLMMGNLSPGLKSHAVTMFEVGKLSDESLDSFLIELEKVADVGEGEARRYFDHALTLRNTILFLRYNTKMVIPVQNGPEGSGEGSVSGLGLDLIRCESLQNLDQDTCSRLLNKNYSLLISMAPLTNEIRPITSSHPPHLGPAIPEVNSVWFKLYMYSVTQCGPPSLLLVKGTKLRVLPRMFRDHEKLLVTTWGHDPGTMPVSNALPTLNDALCHSALLIQGQGTGGEFIYIPFPFDKSYNTSSVLLASSCCIKSPEIFPVLPSGLDSTSNFPFNFLFLHDRAKVSRNDSLDNFAILNLNIHIALFLHCNT